MTAGSPERDEPHPPDEQAGGRERLACVTLDLENNWYFDEPPLAYATFEFLDEYVALVDSLDVPLSVFVVGETVEERPDAISRLRDGLDVEFHLHSYSHDLSGSADFRREVRKGRRAFESFFGRSPTGYRSTQGRITRPDLEVLDAAGFRFDSSVFPTYRPGVYNNLRAPIEPYRPLESGALLEIPLGVAAGIRVPLALGYVSAIGRPLIAALPHLELPDVVVFNTHLQDLYHTRAHERLDQPRRLFYGRNVERAETIFGTVVAELRRRGYSFVRMSDVCEGYHDRADHRSAERATPAVDGDPDG